MSALAIVEYFDVLKDRGSRFISVLETTVMDDLVLERAEKTLRHCIVVTVPPPAHALGRTLESDRGNFLI